MTWHCMNLFFVYQLSNSWTRRYEWFICFQFDKFLKENDSKRSRAIRKANEEKEMKKQKDKEIEKMKSVIDTMNAAKGV